MKLHLLDINTDTSKNSNKLWPSQSATTEDFLHLEVLETGGATTALSVVLLPAMGSKSVLHWISVTWLGNCIFYINLSATMLKELSPAWKSANPSRIASQLQSLIAKPPVHNWDISNIQHHQESQDAISSLPTYHCIEFPWWELQHNSINRLWDTCFHYISGYQYTIRVSTPWKQVWCGALTTENSSGHGLAVVVMALL